MSSPFEYGASYRARRDFEAFRDSFVAGEVLVYFQHATSIYDDMQGFFFREPGSRRVRSWDIGLGEDARADDLFERVADPDPLIAACASGDVARARSVLRDDPSDAYRLSVELALRKGIEAGSALVASLLLPRLPDAELRFALLHHAAGAGKAGPVAILLDSGVPVDAEDGGGQTPLFHAATSGNLATVELLLACGANPRHTRPDGTTPLALARAWKHDAVVAALEGAGA